MTVGDLTELLFRKLEINEKDAEGFYIRPGVTNLSENERSLERYGLAAFSHVYVEGRLRGGMAAVPRTKKTKKFSSATQVPALSDPEVQEARSGVPHIDEGTLSSLRLGLVEIPIKMFELAAESRRARRIYQQHVATLETIFADKDPKAIEVILTGMIAETDRVKCKRLTVEDILSLAADEKLHVEIIDDKLCEKRHHRYTVFELSSSQEKGKWNPDVKIRMMLYKPMENNLAMALARVSNDEKSICREETVLDIARVMQKVKHIHQGSRSQEDEIDNSGTAVPDSNAKIRDVMGLDAKAMNGPYRPMYRLAQKSYAVWKVFEEFATMAETGFVKNVTYCKTAGLNRGVASESRFSLAIFKNIVEGCKSDEKMIEVLNLCIQEKSYNPMIIQNGRKPKGVSKTPKTAAVPPQKRRLSSTPEATENGEGNQQIAGVTKDDTASESETNYTFGTESLWKKAAEGERERNTKLESELARLRHEVILLRLHKQGSLARMTHHTSVFLDSNLQMYRSGKKVEKSANSFNTTCFGRLQPGVKNYTAATETCIVDIKSVLYLPSQLLTHHAGNKATGVLPSIDVHDTLLNDLFLAE